MIETWYLLLNHKKELLSAPSAADARHIAGLKKAIKQAQSIKLQHIDAADLTVWQCNQPTLLATEEDKLQEHLLKINFDNRDQIVELTSGTDLADLKLGEDEVLLVQVPDIPSKTEGDQYQYYENAKKCRLHLIAPSKLNDYNEYWSLQYNQTEKILDNCPKPDLDIPPLPLLYRGFGRFRDATTIDKMRPQMLTRNIKTLVDRFVEEMCKLLEAEDKQHDIERALSQILFPYEKILFDYSLQASTAQSDGHVCGAHGGPILIVVYQFEDGPAELRMAGYFHRLASETRQDIALGWRQPCLGIIIGVSSISFHGLVMVDSQVRSLPITNPFSCNDSETHSRPRLYAAFRAAQTFVEDIERDAKKYAASPPPPIPQEHRRLPNVGALCRVSSSDKKERLEFQIKENLRQNVKSRFIYVAETSGPNPEKIVVKFTRKYGRELHEFCAENNYSPKLLAYERLPGGWIGVAMEFVASAGHFMESKFSQECRQQWLDEMDEMVAKMHGAGYVHGDLRPQNFMVDQKKLLLIDFDWGDKEGTATFPDEELVPILRLGRDQVKITQEDDMRVLEYTKNKLQDM